MALPTVADSLAGRMETLSLLPLSQNEIELSSVNWIDRAFSGQLPGVDQAVLGSELVERVLRGGYPEAITRATARRRLAWARQYIDAIIQRDVRDVASIEKLDQLPRFLRALAQTAGQMCNYAQLGGQVGLDGRCRGQSFRHRQGQRLARLEKAGQPGRGTIQDGGRALRWHGNTATR